MLVCVAAAVAVVSAVQYLYVAATAVAVVATRYKPL